VQPRSGIFSGLPGVVTPMEKLTLLYVMDPHCGWCYGFKPVINRAREEFAGRLDFRLVFGGMITGDRVGPVAPMSDYLRTAIPRLEATTGVTLGDRYKHQVLETGTLVTDSVPPSLAVLAAGLQKPGCEFDVLSAIQDLQFQDGQDLNTESAYYPVLEQTGLDKTAWIRDWKSDEVRYLFNQDLQLTRQLGISGFPAVILVKGTTGHLAGRGYVAWPELKNRIDDWMNRQA